MHERCEQLFETGSPNKVINGARKEKNRLQRELEKTEKRAKAIANNATRTISTLVIDGNNMCYEGSDFIGLKALITSTSELVKNTKLS